MDDAKTAQTDAAWTDFHLILIDFIRAEVDYKRASAEYDRILTDCVNAAKKELEAARRQPSNL